MQDEPNIMQWQAILGSSVSRPRFPSKWQFTNSPDGMSAAEVTYHDSSGFQFSFGLFHENFTSISGLELMTRNSVRKS